jgi:hypothetical protein
MNTPDLTGPILIAVALGVLLLLSGKLHFGDIMGLTVIGAVLLYFLLNFMSNVSKNIKIRKQSHRFIR